MRSDVAIYNLNTSFNAPVLTFRAHNEPVRAVAFPVVCSSEVLTSIQISVLSKYSFPNNIGTRIFAFFFSALMLLPLQ
jgi:hypothetical protein